MGWITLASVIVNAVAVVVGPWIARKLVNKQAELDTTKKALTTVATGLKVVEAAVEANKDLLNKTGAGNKVTQTITSYGPAAAAVVDLARTTIHTLDDFAAAERAAYEQRILDQARAAHDERMKILQAEAGIPAAN